MTLPKKNSRSIAIDDDRFRYIISTSATGEAGLFKLNLIVQIESGNGRIMKADGLLARDFWLDFPQVEPPDAYPIIGPAQVACVIRLACRNGWDPGENGAPFVLGLTADALRS